MESIKHPFPWLELVEHPAFCVQNGVIVAANSTAKNQMISVGTDIYELVKQNRAAYDTFKNGSLYLTITIGDLPYDTSITRTSEYDIFVITRSEEDSQLQALALAAQKLRIPLSNMMTVTDRLLSNLDQDNSETQQMSGQINRSLFQLLRIVSNMSDANSYKKSATIGMQNVNLTALFDEIIDKIQTVSAYTNKNLSYTGPDCPVIGLANDEKLGRAVYNLIANALKFSPTGSTVDAKLTQHENKLIFTVRNSNPEPIDDYAFWTRYNREPAIEDERFGLGLGMSLISSAACTHGGTVLVDHPTPAETRVTMTIPIVKKDISDVRSPVLKIGDYAGGRDKGLLELAELLPTDSYHKIN